MSEREGFERLNLYTGQRVETEDVAAAERYHLEKARLLRRGLGWGVVRGVAQELRVRALEEGAVEVAPGYAVDRAGRDLLVESPRRVELPEAAEGVVYVVARLVEDPVDYVVNRSNPRYKGHTRIHERVVLEAGVEVSSDGVELARLVGGPVRDAVDPEAPGAGELDLRFRAWFGTPQAPGGAVREGVRGLCGDLRRSMGGFARGGVGVARDLRAAAMTLGLLAEAGGLDEGGVRAGLGLLAELSRELREEADRTVAGLRELPEYARWAGSVDDLEEAAGLEDLSEGVERFRAGVEGLTFVSAQLLGLEPLATVPATAEVAGRAAEAPASVQDVAQETAQEVEQATAQEVEPVGGTVDAVWELAALPTKLVVGEETLGLVDRLDFDDADSEAAYDFRVEEARQDWRSQQELSYPDGTLVDARGRQYVGGAARWTARGLTPGRDLLVVKRVDVQYGAVETRLEVGGVAVGVWAVGGGDAEHRWRNAAFRVPGAAITGSEVELREVPVDPERDVNVYGVWHYQ